MLSLLGQAIGAGLALLGLALFAITWIAAFTGKIRGQNGPAEFAASLAISAVLVIAGGTVIGLARG